MPAINLLHNDLDGLTLEQCRAYFTANVNENNNGASTIHDNTDAVVPLGTSPYTIPAKASFMASIASASYYSDNTPYMGSDVNNANSVFYNADMANPHVYDKIYDADDLLIYYPMVDSADYPDTPIIISFKGTDTSNYAELLMDLHLFHRWETSSTYYSGFDVQVQNKIYLIKTLLYEADPKYNLKPKYFTSHSLGSAYCSKVFHYFYVNYPTTTKECYLFNPYILPDPTYDSIVELCRTDLTFHDSIHTYSIETDPASLMMNKFGFGNIHIYPSRIDATSSSWIGDFEALKAIVGLKEYFQKINHSFYNWTLYDKPIEYRSTLLEASVLSTHQTNVPVTIESELEYHVDRNGLVTMEHLALKLNENNHLISINYPELGENINNYTGSITPFNRSVHYDSGLENKISTLYQPYDNTNNRLKYFSIPFEVHNLYNGNDIYNYFYFFKKTMALHNRFYIAFIEATYDENVYNTYYLRTTGDNANAVTNQHDLIKMSKTQMDNIFNGISPQGNPYTATLATTMRQKATFDIVDAWDIVSHPDTASQRRTIGTNPGLQPYNAFFFTPGLAPVTGGDGKQYVDVRMRFDKVAPQRYIVFSSHGNGASVLETSDFFTTDVRYKQPDWRITFQGFDAQGVNLGYDIENKDHADFGTATTSSLSRVYNTDGGSGAHAVEANKYFDIESVIDPDTQIEYYHILSKEHTTDRYLSYMDGWPTTNADGTGDHPVGDGVLDPIYFENELIGAGAKNQYIRFFSTASPHSVYEPTSGITS